MNLIRKQLSQLKRGVARQIGQLPLSSTRLGPPRGVKSIAQWFESAQNQWPEARIHRLSESSSISEPPPKGLEPELPWLLAESLQREQTATYVLDIPFGRVWGKRGTIISPDDDVLSEVSREFGASVPQQVIFGQLKLAPMQKFSGTVAVLATDGSQVYYHWLFDVLPRLELLRRAGLLEEVDAFVIDHKGLPFQTQSLEILGIPETKIIRSNDITAFHLEAKRLLVPSLPSNLGGINAWTAEFLRKTYHGSPPQKAVGKRLYLSRARANNRLLLNEAEVFGLLEPLGFEEFHAEDHSFSEQVWIFRHAEAIVGPHGSGFANTVFSKAGTKVIDIQPPSYINSCFWIVANQVKLDYYYLIGEGNRPTRDHNFRLKQDDIQVNIEDLKKLLDHANLSTQSHA